MTHQGIYTDLTKDTEDVPAVVPNANKVADMLGYSDGPKSTPVRRIIIHKDGRGVDLSIKDGRYASATFAHCVCVIANPGVEKVMLEARITDDAIGFLRQFMGAKIMKESEAPDTRHTFVRALLDAQGGKLLVVLSEPGS